MEVSGTKFGSGEDALNVCLDGAVYISAAREKIRDCLRRVLHC